MTGKETKESLLRENQQLRERLEEHEEAMRAIGSGEVDALVVSGPEGEQIVTLKDALDAYRVMVEAMSNGALTLTRDSTILYCNDYFARMVGIPHNQVIGMPFADMVAAQDRGKLGKMLALGTTRDVRNELILQPVDGKPAPVYLAMQALPESGGQEVAVVVTDLAEISAATEARTRLAMIIESSDDAIISTTLEGVVQSWNHAAEKLFGYRANETIGRDIQSVIVPPEHKGEVKLKFDAIRRGERTQHVETERFRKDGSLIPVSIVASPIIDATDRVVGVSINIRDISERKASEASLKLFRELLDQAHDAIEVIDPETLRYLDVNEGSCRHLGYSRDELLTMGVPDIHVNIDELPLERINNDLQANRPVVFDTVHVRKDGSTFPVEVSITQVRTDKTYIIAVSRDITERKQAEDAVRASEVRFKTMFEQAPLGIAQIGSLDGRIYELNSRFAEIAGRPMEAMANIDWVTITHPDDIQPDLDNMALMNAGKISGFQMEKRYLRPDGTFVWIDMTISSLKVEDKSQPRHLCMIQDISERKATEARVAYLSRVHTMLSGINTLIVRVLDRNELFRGACQIATEAGGFRMAMICTVDRLTNKVVPVETAGKDKALLSGIKDLLSSDQDSSNTMVEQAIRDKKTVVSNDSSNDPRTAFGKQYAELGVRSKVVLPLIVSDEVVGALALFAREIDFFHEEELKLLNELACDISYAIDHIDKQEKLNFLAYYDALTGLANRSLFLDRLEVHIHSAVSGGYKLAIGLIDLERFKNINDSLGRPVGDMLLKQVAEWIAQRTGGNLLLARIDSDHFAIVLPKVKPGGSLARLIEKLATSFMSHSFLLNDTVFRIGIKIGVALFPDDGADADTLFKNAEAALKKAKAEGHRYLFYRQTMTESVADRLALENQLRQALDNEEFVLHYQPKIDLEDGKITGAEALIRWNDPLTGLVPPGKFIPILEETGLINDVGRWAMRKAIEDNLRWRSAGLPALRIAVNISELQLRSHNFMADLKQAIAIDAHAADGLELEITESMVMEDIEHNLTKLEAIRALGITIAIDDFGTGFSSLSYLAKLSVDTLKIDRSFVIEMTTGEEGLALVSTIISLAHAFKLKVIAEGVETEEQANLLRSLDCDEMQGFLFSKAVPSEEFETRFLGMPARGYEPKRSG